MAEGRRHSVDIPLSKTLVALKRVRSLRDPDTNSMTKFATVDNMNWDLNSCSGALLDFSNPDKHHGIQSQKYHLKGETTDLGNNSESDGSSRVPYLKYTNTKKSSAVLIGGPDQTRTKAVHGPCRDRTRMSLGSTCVPRSANLLEEEVDSYCGQNFELDERVKATVASKKSGYGVLRKPSAAVEDALMSRVGSPCMSVAEAYTNGSSRSTLGLASDEVDIVDSSLRCGISYCWSRTPKYRDPSFVSDVEDQEHPLLSAEGRETAYKDVTPYPESPRSLSQKFRPKSFNDLVGLNVLAKSLNHAISKGKVAPMYLFHGPRGTGKTLTARIFAASLTCLSLEERRPCGFCRECMLLFSGRSRDVKELDAAKINRKDKLKALLKSASLVPFSSSFKVFIIDECQFLREETWAAILSSLEEVSRHAVFVMVTSELDKLPCNCASHCQRYYFPKIKEADTICRLKKICEVEGLEYEKDALEFIAIKSNGSLRDAETMLDQLALLGKRISMSLAYELVGVVSDDELLDLLDLALSSDTSNTVRRARELMRSRVDPMQLISQLADLIMDILAGRRQSGLLEAGRKFFGRQALAEADLHKLRHALKILSETEKQLRTSKNQATWLTVALLQFSAGESSSLMDVNDSKGFQRDNGVSSTASPRESLKNSVCHVHGNNKSNCLQRCCNRTELETIWRRTIEKCQSSSLKSFLLKKGSLLSVYVNEGLAIAEVEFSHPDHVSRAEKSWELIADSLQHVLGCNVEIRVKLVPTFIRKNAKVKKSSFSLLSCSRRKQEMSDSTLADENETDTSVRRETFDEAYPSDYGQQFSPFIQQMDASTMHHSSCFNDNTATIRNNEDEVRNTGISTSNKSVQGNLPKGCKSESNFSQEVGQVGQHFDIQDPEIQPSCFAKTIRLQRRFLSTDVAHTICLRIQPHNKLELSIPKKAAHGMYFCTYDPYNLCSRSNSQVTYSSGEENLSSKDSRFSSKFLCWKTPKSSASKVP